MKNRYYEVSTPSGHQSLGLRSKSRNPKQPGFVYVHRWATGFQELVFTSHEAAKKWISTLGPLLASSSKD